MNSEADAASALNDAQSEYDGQCILILTVKCTSEVMDMWDWELIRKPGHNSYVKVVTNWENEQYKFSHAISSGSANDAYSIHNHALHEIVYCISGRCTYLIEENFIQVESGTLLIIYPTVPHRVILPDDEPYERFSLYIDCLANSDYISRMMLKSGSPYGEKRIGSMFYSGNDLKPIHDAFQRINRICESNSEQTANLMPCFMQTAVAEILLLQQSRAPEQVMFGTVKTVDSLLLFLNENFMKPITLQSVAEHFFLSRDHCNRIFKQATGMTVIQYITYCRVLYARKLLMCGVGAVETAEKVGFSDYSNFYRSYKKITGRSPSDDYE